jgi:hypothetical protein
MLVKPLVQISPRRFRLHWRLGQAVTKAAFDNCYGPGTRGPYAISLSSGAHYI